MKFKPVLILFLLSLFIYSIAHADSTFLSEEQYWALVEESHALVLQLKDKSDEQISLQLNQLAVKWEAFNEVEVNGKRVPVNHQSLIDLMKADTPNLDVLEKTFASFLDARTNSVSDVFSSADTASLTKILARPEFQWAESIQNPASDWLNNILATISRWIDKLLGVTFNLAGSDLTAIFMGLLLVLVFVFVFRTLAVDLLNESELKENAEEEPLTSEAALAKAQQLSRGGDYRTAVRYLYLSTLLILDERGVMRYDRSKTNREYLRSVANSPELSKPLGEVIEVFDNVWYGNHELEEESFKHYSKRVEELKEK